MNAGQALLSTSSGLVPLPWLALAGGLALHLMLMLVAGGLFALVALRARGPVLALGAASYAVCIALAAQWVGPSALGAFGTLLSTRPQWIFLMALIAFALMAGVRWSRVSSKLEAGKRPRLRGSSEILLSALAFLFSFWPSEEPRNNPCNLSVRSLASGVIS
jgi:hypothetical protein